MKNFIITLFLFIIFSNSSFACALLQVPIGTPVNSAKNTFAFLSEHKPEFYGEYISARYVVPAQEYCEGANLQNSDLELIVHDNMVVKISIMSNYSEIKNEVYEFVRTRIGEPGEDVQKDDWVGIKDLSVGSLIMIYGKTKLRGEILEVLEITNNEMEKYTTYEEIIDVFG